MTVISVKASTKKCHSVDCRNLLNNWHLIQAKLKRAVREYFCQYAVLRKIRRSIELFRDNHTSPTTRPRRLWINNFRLSQNSRANNERRNRILLYVCSLKPVPPLLRSHNPHNALLNQFKLVRGHLTIQMLFWAYTLYFNDD